MNDKEELTKLYQDMYMAMIHKDESELNRVHDDSFVLEHMTGMHQNKQEYIKAIMNGTLNYYSSKLDHLDIHIQDGKADMVGHSIVEAAVFGGSRHTWKLALEFEAVKGEGKWKLAKAKASTW